MVCLWLPFHDWAHHAEHITHFCSVLITGATINSLGAEFVRVMVPLADTVWIAGRTPET